MVDQSPDAAGVAQASGPILRATAVAPSSLGAPRFPRPRLGRLLQGELEPVRSDAPRETGTPTPISWV